MRWTTGIGWTNPRVLTGLIGGAALLVIFGIIESKIAEPMFRLSLFKIRAFAAGNAASLMSSMARAARPRACGPRSRTPACPCPSASSSR